MRRAPTPPQDASLGLQTPPARLRAAIALHDQLVVKVERRRKVKDQLVADTRAAVTHLSMRMHTLVVEARALDDEIHGLMQGLIADGRRSKRQRAELEQIYRGLEDGVIQPRPRAGTPPDRRWQPFEPRAGAGGDHERERFVPSKPRPAERGTLRSLFRRLAEALHPDKVQSDDERARRTEIMKQITVAYQDGDYARLLEIERAWASSAEPELDAAPDELERRLAAKERAIAELQTQLAAVEREIRALRASEDGKLAKVYQRHGGAEGRTPDEVEAERDVARMREVKDFILAFQAGEITFARFRDGPAGAADDLLGALGDDDLTDEELEAAVFDPLLDVELDAGPPPDLAEAIAELARVAQAQGLSPREILRIIEAAAAGADAGPRPRGRGRRR